MFHDQRPDNALPITPVALEDFSSWRTECTDAVNAWMDAQGFDGTPGSVCLLPGEDGAPKRALTGMNRDQWLWSLAAIPAALPGLDCYLEPDLDSGSAHLATLGFALATYRFTRYGKTPIKHAGLSIPTGVSRAAVEADFSAVSLVRDLVNTAPEDLMPQHLEEQVKQVAAVFSAQVNTIVGDDLLRDGYPAIHAVGRASVHAPRLIDLTWGDKSAPKVTLVGKGVCFDSGGLDIKPASGMRWMKKDMGGAAHALALGQRVMAEGLPVRLRVLIPAVENAISGNAFHPGDVLDTRAGKTVEIDNTDAEGRLVLCDALTEACSENPAQIMDFATLTGAARVALGAELGAMFCNNDTLADEIFRAGEQSFDPVWRMPLHQPYRSLLDSNIADLVNSAGTPHGGAITAALFLESFVTNDIPWSHFDIMAWNNKARPGRPEGGEAVSLRACFSQLCKRFGT